MAMLSRSRKPSASLGIGITIGSPSTGWGWGRKSRPAAVYEFSLETLAFVNQLLPIRDRLRRAGEHLREIEGLLRSFYSDQPYSLITGQFDPDAHEIRYAFGQVFDPPPVRLATLSGEVLHDLRSSLDHLAWELVEQNQPGAATEQTHFPLLKVPPTANKKGVSPPPYVPGSVSSTALGLIEREQPYQLGSSYVAHPLYVLHELNVIDKHRHITVRGVRSEGTYIAGPVSHFAFTARLVSASEWGAEIVFVPDDPTVDAHFQSTFQVVVHEVGPGIVIPLLNALRDAQDSVETIVSEAMQTCFALPPPIVV